MLLKIIKAHHDNSCMYLSEKGPELLTLFLTDRPLGHCNFTDLKSETFKAG